MRLMGNFSSSHSVWYVFYPFWELSVIFIKSEIVVCILYPKQQIMDSSKLKEFADDNFKFNENGRNLFKMVKYTVGKGEIARYEQFILFPQRFQKTFTADT